MTDLWAIKKDVSRLDKPAWAKLMIQEGEETDTTALFQAICEICKDPRNTLMEMYLNTNNKEVRNTLHTSFFSDAKLPFKEALRIMLAFFDRKLVGDDLSFYDAAVGAGNLDELIYTTSPPGSIFSYGKDRVSGPVLAFNLSLNRQDFHRVRSQRLWTDVISQLASNMASLAGFDTKELCVKLCVHLASYSLRFNATQLQFLMEWAVQYCNVELLSLRSTEATGRSPAALHDSIIAAHRAARNG